LSIEEIEKIKPFRISKLTDVIDEEVLIVIGGKMVAALFSGQKRFEGMDDEVEEQARRMTNEHKRLRFSKMKRMLRKMDVATEADIKAFMDKLDSMVKHITALGEQNYVIKKRLQEELFFDELASYFEYSYEADINPLWDRLERVLQRVNEFIGTQISMFFINEDRESKIWNCQAAAGVPKKLSPNLRLDCTQMEDFRLDTAFDISIDEDYLFLEGEKADIEKFLGNYYLVPITLQRRLDGLLAFKHVLGRNVLDELADLAETHARTAYFEVAQSQRIKEREAHIQKLEEVNEEREEFIAETAHVLRGPMQSILSEAEYLAYRCPKIHHQDENIMKSANKTIEEVGILKNKLDNSLLFGDMERRIIEYELRENSLVSLIEECANQFRNIAKRERDINIIVRVDDLPDFKFDWDMMDIVFANLLDNAVKYSHGGKDIYVRGTVLRNEVEIEVEDFGLGIKEEEKGKIFQKYYRAELKDRRRFIPGTGIGLTVARKVVEDHGGRIDVDSRPAGGIHHDPEKLKAGEAFITTFTVSLPYQMNEEEK